MCIAGMSIHQSPLQLCDYPALAEHLESQSRLLPITYIFAIAVMQTAANELRAEHARRLNDPNVPTWEN